MCHSISLIIHVEINRTVSFCVICALNVWYTFRDKEQRIADIFVKKGPFLKLYTSYIREFETMSGTLEEARKKYPEFDQAVKDFEVR